MILLGVDATPIMSDASTVQSVRGILNFAPTAAPLDSASNQQVQVTGIDWPTFFTNCTNTYNTYLPL